MTNDDSQIRPMREEDWREFKKIDEEIFPDDSVDQESFQKYVADRAFFALEVEGRLVGMLIVARFGEDAGHLGRIGVSTSMQNRGLGAKLMEFAMNWFRKEKVSQAILYTQDYNKHAQHLYKKFGFERVGTTWHYFVPFKSLSPRGECTCHHIREDEIELVGQKYPEHLPAAQIRRFLESEDYHVLVLKDSSGEITGACRFTPGFPGCFPFQIDDLECLDDFLASLIPHSLPDFDYVRLTFTDNEILSAICDERRYKRHHRLYRMKAEVSKQE